MKSSAEVLQAAVAAKKNPAAIFADLVKARLTALVLQNMFQTSGTSRSGSSSSQNSALMQRAQNNTTTTSSSTSSTGFGTTGGGGRNGAGGTQF